MRSQRGFSMIEALIAFVILSVGLLGIVSLQTLAKTSQHLAIQHTRAVTFADAIIERIRINPAGVAAYNIGLTPLGTGAEPDEPDPDCRGTVCDPNELAAHDLWVWDQALRGAAAKVGTENQAGLIEPRGCIQFAAPDPNRPNTGRLTVIIQWRGLQESFDAVQSGEAACGGDGAGTDPNRRQVVTSTFVIDESEF